MILCNLYLNSDQLQVILVITPENITLWRPDPESRFYGNLVCIVSFIRSGLAVMKINNPQQTAKIRNLSLVPMVNITHDTYTQPFVCGKNLIRSINQKLFYNKPLTTRRDIFIIFKESRKSRISQLPTLKKEAPSAERLFSGQWY